MGTRSTRDGRCRYPPIPQFPAERFAYIRPADVRHKRFDEAVRQLEEEGLMQVFVPATGLRHPIVGVVGPLQFDVVEARLRAEYGIPCTLEPLAHVAGAVAGAGTRQHQASDAHNVGRDDREGSPGT